MKHFTTEYSEIKELIEIINPINYAKTRNFIDGDISKISPFISRGVISTKYILDSIIKRGYTYEESEKFIQELAWRDYYQQIWIDKKEKINDDLKNKQEKVSNELISTAIINHSTGIEALDKGIQELYDVGYMHNHVRMYVASLCCNIAQSHWKLPSKWMYYHLLDADWASNTLSWQWIVGSFSNKKYYANQQNINTYCHTNQENTFLDVEYDEFDSLSIPSKLNDYKELTLKTKLPEKSNIIINDDLPLLIYNFYNLDPLWKQEINANRILLLEPSFFEKYPSSSKVIDFIIALSHNIPNIQLMVASFEELQNLYKGKKIVFKEHPTNSHYIGTQQNREFLVDTITGYHPSFFSYWKKIKKVIKKQF